MDMTEILRLLCAEKGVSGNEDEMADIIKKLLPENMEIISMDNGTLIACTGNIDAEPHIMLDAHIDRIGLIVTYIDDRGFIKAEPVGGIDLRTLSGSAVAIKASGAADDIMGVICSVPPHLSKDDEGMTRDNIWIDTGMSAEYVKENVLSGDRILVKSRFRTLLGNKAAVSGLDNRAGCAVLIRCAELLNGEELPCRLSLVFSSQEETNESGGRTAAFMLEPDEAVAVDVGFAKQSGVPSDKSGKQGGGPIITISPVLSRKISNRLIKIARDMNINFDYETDGGATGTNADAISATRGGVPCGLISVPEKNMHTQTETVSLNDIEDTAALLAAYVKRGGMNGD